MKKLCSKCKKVIKPEYLDSTKGYIKMCNCKYMKKQIGKIGEEYIINLLEENNIDYQDLRENKIKKTKCVFIKGEKIYYDTMIKSHPFDLIVNDKNIEIKTSTIDKKGRVNFCLLKNNKEQIDYVIGLVYDNGIKYIYLFDEEVFLERTGIGFSLKKDMWKDYKITEKDLIKRLWKK